MIGINIEKPKCCLDCPCYSCEFATCCITNIQSWEFDPFEEVLEGCPLVEDVAPVEMSSSDPTKTTPTAEWVIDPSDGERHCSHCHAILEDYMSRYVNFYYCYHCGAEMSNPHLSPWRRIPTKAEQEVVAADANNDTTASLLAQISADLDYAAQHDIDLPGEAYLMEAILEFNNIAAEAPQQQEVDSQKGNTESDYVSNDNLGSN